MNTRREFIKKTSALGILGVLSNWAFSACFTDKIGNTLPLRRFIRDGEKVTSFCLGGFHVGLPDDPAEAEKLIERAIELGVRFFDNARRYHNGRSEEYMGKFLVPKYRDEIFLMTKSHARNGEDAWKHLDESLQAYNTDQIDLWQMHHISTPEDVDNRINNGVLDVFLEAKAKKKVRYIGFTGHRNPKTHLHLLSFLKERGIDMDATQMPLNVCDPSFESFQTQVLPELLEREYGVIAMKTMAGGSMLGKRIDTTPKSIKTEDIPDLSKIAGISREEMHQYVYSLPVSTLCSGCETIAELEHNVDVLKNFHQLSDDQMEKLIGLAKSSAGMTVENYKRVME